MHCEGIPGGFVCFSGPRPAPKPCVDCGQPATRLCDGPGSGRKKTCDAPICELCRYVAGEADLCPRHAPALQPNGIRVDGDPPLQVFTAQMGLRDGDYLDITVRGNHRLALRGEPLGHREIGAAFTPDPDLLYAALAKKRAGQLTDEDWKAYAANYVLRMRQSYRERRAAWTTLLSWRRVVLICFCEDAAQCHRTVLARAILPKLGAVFVGELGRNGIQEQARAT
jgi:hypothetical protein